MAAVLSVTAVPAFKPGSADSILWGWIEGNEAFAASAGSALTTAPRDMRVTAEAPILTSSSACALLIPAWTVAALIPVAGAAALAAARVGPHVVHASVALGKAAFAVFWRA